jgi:hypothetical protein
MYARCGVSSATSTTRNLHGANINASEAYEPFIDRLMSRADLNYVSPICSATSPRSMSTSRRRSSRRETDLGGLATTIASKTTLPLRRVYHGENWNPTFAPRSQAGRHRP